MMNQLAKKHYGGIDLLKHLLSLFVIFQHMRSESRYSSETNLLIDGIVKYIDGAVIGFFVISGFFFHYRESFKNSFLKIIKRTIIPFLLFSIIYSVVMSFLGKSTLIEGLLGIITLKGSSMQLYYLTYLLLIYTFYLLIFKIFQRNRNLNYILIGLFLTLTIISLLFPTLSPTGSDLKLILIYSLCFGIGIYLSFSLKNSTKQFNINSLILIGLFLILGKYDFRFYHISIMLVFFVAAYYVSIKNSFFNKQFAGSGGVYLLHTPIFNFGISTILFSIGILEKQNLFLSLALTYISTLLITFFFIKLFPKYRFLLLE